METNSKEDRIAAGAAPPPQAILPSYHLVGGGGLYWGPRTPAVPISVAAGYVGAQLW